MSERMSRGRGSAPSSQPPARNREGAAAAPGDVARDAATVLETDARSLESVIEKLRGAHAANAADTWVELRARLDRALVDAERAVETARRTRGDAAPEVRERLDAAERRVEELVAAARELTEAPSGVVAVTRESELLAILDAPVEGSAAAGFAHKERALRAEFDRLAPGESRMLAQRLRKARPADALASQFQRMTVERRERLLQYLEGARRREVIRDATATDVKATLNAGTTLDSTIATKIGKAFGTDVSGVRIHTDAAGAELAAQHGAPAVTIGNDIAFASGAYRPHTLDGDALIAHELAHVVQQRGAEAATDKPLESTDTAHEGDADQAAHGAIAEIHHGVASAGAKPMLTSELRVARGHPIIGLDAPARLVGLGGGAQLAIRPAMDSSEPAIVGMTLRCNIDRTYVPRGSGTIFVGSWDLVSPTGHHFPYMSQELADFPINEVGDHVLRVEIITERSGDRTKRVIEHRFKAIKKEDKTRELLPKVADTSYADLRGSIDIQHALLSPPGPDKQANGDYRINTATPNPAPEMPSDLFPPIMFQIERTGSGPPPPGVTYHWYVKPLNKTKGYHRDRSPAVGNLAPAKLDGQPGFHDMGKDPIAKLVPNERNVYIIICRINDSTGKRLSEARYVQTVLSKEEREDFEKFAAYRERSGKLAEKLDASSRTVLNCIHVATDTAHVMRPQLVAGVSGNGITIVDLTPGLEPKDHKLEFHGSDLDDALSQFRSANRYPRGHMRISVPGNHSLGAKALVKQYEMETTGESELEKWSGRFGLASLVLLAGAMIAAPFTGGGSVVVTLLLIGSAVTGVVAGSLSLAERLRHAEISPTGVAIDIVGIVGSLISGAAALRALAAGGQAINIASQASRFILWSNFVTASVAAVLVSVEAVAEIKKVLDSDLSPGEKAALLVRVVTTMALTGAVLALSYKDMNSVRARLGNYLAPELEKALSGEARLTLNLLDDGALRGIGTAARPATTDELGRLANILRSDSQLIQRIAGRTDLLDVLRITRGETRDAFELGMMRIKIAPRIGAAHAERVANALDRAGVPGRIANDLGEDALLRLASDPERAAALYHRYGDDLLRLVRAAPAESLDRIAERLAQSRPNVAAQNAPVFELTNVRNVAVAGAPGGMQAVDGNLGPNDLNRDLRGMARTPRAHAATVAFDPRGAGGAQTRGRITVTDPHGKPMTIDVEVTATRALDTPGGAAGSQPSRLDLLAPDATAGRPRWRANITISNRLRREDVASVVGRKLDEAIDIARSGDRQMIQAEQRSVAFAPGVRIPTDAARATASDRAAMRQLEAMYADLQHQQAVLAGHERGGTATPAMRAGVQQRAERVQRQLRTMGLEDPTRFIQGQKLLRQMGMPEAELKSLQVLVEQRAFAALPHPGLTATQPVMTSDLLDHLLHPRPQAPAVFGARGIDGGHQTENLLRFIDANPQYAVVEQRAQSAGGTVYREYKQYRWKQPGPPPAVGDPRRPGGRGFTAAEQAKWEVANVPKTTADTLQPYLREAEAAWEGWRSANFTPGPPASGAATVPGRFTTRRTAIGVIFEGGFVYIPGPPPRWQLNTVYPII